MAQTKKQRREQRRQERRLGVLKGAEETVKKGTRVVGQIRTGTKKAKKVFRGQQKVQTNTAARLDRSDASNADAVRRLNDRIDTLTKQIDQAEARNVHLERRTGRIQAVSRGKDIRNQFTTLDPDEGALAKAAARHGMTLKEFRAMQRQLNDPTSLTRLSGEQIKALRATVAQVDRKATEFTNQDVKMREQAQEANTPKARAEAKQVKLDARRERVDARREKIFTRMGDTLGFDPEPTSGKPSGRIDRQLTETLGAKFPGGRPERQTKVDALVESLGEALKTERGQAKSFRNLKVGGSAAGLLTLVGLPMLLSMFTGDRDQEGDDLMAQFQAERLQDQARKQALAESLISSRAASARLRAEQIRESQSSQQLDALRGMQQQFQLRQLMGGGGAF